MKKNNQDRTYPIIFILLLSAILAMSVFLLVLVKDITRLKTAAAENKTENQALSAAAEPNISEVPLSKDDGEGETLTENNGDLEENPAASSATDEAEEETETLPVFSVNQPKVTRFSGHILIGDSRMVFLERSVDYDENDIIICKGAMAYDWFSTEAVSKLRQILDNDPDYAVVINMGVNDCANNCSGWTEYFVQDYIDLINELSFEYPSTRFYFASVGHIKNYYTGTHGNMPADEVNAYIDIFNENMKESCLSTYIDLCEHLDEVGYVWADNVHYATATSQEIYDYIVKNVNGNVN